jgi:hypothetical protein
MDCFFLEGFLSKSKVIDLCIHGYSQIGLGPEGEGGGGGGLVHN